MISGKRIEQPEMKCRGHPTNISVIDFVQYNSFHGSIQHRILLEQNNKEENAVR